MAVHYETCPAAWGESCNCPYGPDEEQRPRVNDSVTVPRELVEPFAFCDATDRREPCNLPTCRSCSLRAALARACDHCDPHEFHTTCLRCGKQGYTPVPAQDEGTL